MLARVADGETLVVSGFTRDREARERQAAGVTGGWFGRSTVVTHKRVELVILLTAKIVAGVVGAMTCTNTTTGSRRSRSA